MLLGEKMVPLYSVLLNLHENKFRLLTLRHLNSAALEILICSFFQPKVCTADKILTVIPISFGWGRIYQYCVCLHVSRVCVHKTGVLNR